MRGFRSEDSFVIEGRGLVYGFAAEQVPDDLHDPCQLNGETVLIDGAEHEIVGVETFAIPRGPENPYRKAFGLLVAESTP